MAKAKKKTRLPIQRISRLCQGKLSFSSALRRGPQANHPRDTSAHAIKKARIRLAAWKRKNTIHSCVVIPCTGKLSRTEMEPKNAKRRSNFRRANRIMPRRRIDIATEALDYKNPDLLKKFVTESGKILPRRVTGMPAHLHRKITREIKRARSVLLMK